MDSYDANHAWPFVHGKSGCDKAGEIHRLKCRAHHEGNNALTQVGMGDADDCSLRHRRMFEESGFDLPRSDSIATRLYQIRCQSSDNAMKTILADASRIAGLN